MQLPAPFHELDGQIAVELAGARALFTTRALGDVRAQHERLSKLTGARVVFARQVHGSDVATVSADGRASVEQADALVTAARAVAPMVLSADCLPIVIAAPGAVGVVHAGWRGLEAGVIARAVAQLRRLGAGGPLQAAIGPGAGVCCYEVGEEVHLRFRRRSQDFRRGANLDLKAIARVQLMEAGVAGVHDARLCTICGDPALTFSYRREGATTGRHGALAWIDQAHAAAPGLGSSPGPAPDHATGSGSHG